MAKQKHKGKIPHLIMKTTNTPTNTEKKQVFVFREETFAISSLCNPGLSLHICKTRINNMILFGRGTAVVLGFIGKKALTAANHLAAQDGAEH